MVLKTKVIICNTANATYKDLTKGRAWWSLKGEGLKFKDAVVGVNSFNFTNFFINIFTGINDKIYYSDAAITEEKYTITIPQGSYSVSSLNTYVQNILVENGHANLFNIYGDFSQNKIYIQFDGVLTGWFVTMKSTVGPTTLLGYNTGTTYIPTGKSNVINEIVYAPNQAQFNNIESVNVETNLGSAFIYGTNVSDILYSAIPTATIGSTQSDKPQNILWCESPELSSGVSTIKIQLKDQTDTAILMSENFSVVIQIMYA